jgi:hypothetical protein
LVLTAALAHGKGTAPALLCVGLGLDGPVRAILAAVVDQLGDKPIAEPSALSRGAVQRDSLRGLIDVHDAGSSGHGSIERRFVKQLVHGTTLDPDTVLGEVNGESCRSGLAKVLFVDVSRSFACQYATLLLRLRLSVSERLVANTRP